MFIRPILILAAGVACLPASAAGAQDRIDLAEQIREEVIVTATRLPSPRRHVGSSVTTFDAEAIQARRVGLLADLLREVPGLAINRSGPVGSVTQARIRGAEGNHTLVLIDGIEANNPAFGFEFNFADLLTDDLARVEVLRGPQSALYGSEAIGGVISVSTKRGHDEQSLQLQAEGGSYETHQYGASWRGGSERLAAYVSHVEYQTDGISASAIEPERDGYENASSHLRIDAELTPVVTLQAVLRHTRAEADADVQDFAFPPGPTQGLVIDADTHTEAQQSYARLALKVHSVDQRWQHELSYGLTDTESDAFAADVFDNGNEGQRQQFDYVVSRQLNDADLTFSVQHEALEFTNRSAAFADANYSADDKQTGYALAYDWAPNERLALQFSVRRDVNDRFDDATTYRAAGAYLFGSGTRVHASWGRGITNPGFFELFGFTPSTFVGNPDLQPERSDAWDIGVEQALWQGRGLLDLTYFRADLKDEILTVFDFATFTSTAANLGRDSQREGVEASARVALTERLQLDFAYTYLDASEPSGAGEVRRPRHSASVNLHYSPGDGRARLNLGAAFHGDQRDAEFVFATPASRVTLDSYTLVNASVFYQVNENIELYLRGDNLLDEQYSEVFGYRSPGRAGKLGVKVSL